MKKNTLQEEGLKIREAELVINGAIPEETEIVSGAQVEELVLKKRRDTSSSHILEKEKEGSMHMWKHFMYRKYCVRKIIWVAFIFFIKCRTKLL